MLWVLIRIASSKSICNEYSLESPCRDSNEYPQHSVFTEKKAILMNTHNICFLWRTDEIYPSIIIKYPPYLFFRSQVAASRETWQTVPNDALLLSVYIHVSLNMHEHMPRLFRIENLFFFFKCRPLVVQSVYHVCWFSKCLLYSWHCVCNC